MPRTKSRAWTLWTLGKPQKVANENPTRVAISIKDPSDTNIYYGFDQNVDYNETANQGWEITANGGSIREEDAKDEIWVNCSAANKKFHVIEVSKVE